MNRAGTLGCGESALNRFRALGSALALAGLVQLPSIAAAAVPSPSQSTIPTHIVLVGTNALGVADPLGAFTVTVRNAGGVPVMGAGVSCSFNRSPDTVLCATQPEASNSMVCDQGLSPYAVSYALSGGVAHFKLVGHANHTLPGAHDRSVDIYADGVLLGTVRVAVLDHDGGGVGPADQSLWLADYFSSEYRERSDLDGDGVLGPSDLSIWQAAFFSAGSIQGCPGATCP